MIRHGFVSNSSSTCGMIDARFNRCKEVFPENFDFWDLKLKPFYDPNLYNYFISQNENKKYTVYYRMKPSEDGMDYFPRFINHFDKEYNSIKDVLKEFPSAEYCGSQYEMIKRIFEVDPLKHLKFEEVESTYSDGHNKSVRIDNELGRLHIDSEGIRKLIGDEEYRKINETITEGLTEHYDQGSINPIWNTEGNEK